MNQVVDLTKGKVSKAIFVFFGPMLVTNLLQQLYTFVDTAIVGNGLGDNAFAAVGNMGSLTFFVIGFSLGLANGFGVLLAQHFGAKDFERLRHTLAACIQLCGVLIIIMTLISTTALKSILILLQTDPLILPDSLKYGHIIFGGLFSSVFYNMSACTLRAFGDSKTPLKAIITSSILNVCLDYFLIFVCRTGVEGAAIATIFSQVVSASICVNKIRKISFVNLKKSDFKNPVSEYILLLKNGIPMAIMNSITAIGVMVVQYFVNGYGAVYTSAYACCGRYINLFMTPACSAGNTMSAFAGQNSGAGRYDRIRKGLLVCLAIAFIAYVIFGFIMVAFGRNLAEILLDGEEAINLTLQYFPVCGATIIIVDFLFVYRSAVQGMGYPFVPMCSGLSEMACRIIPIAIFIGRVGFVATAYAEVAAWSGALILNMASYYYHMSKFKKLENPV